ncbi:MAG: UDP-N-acetylmuramoyl-tripeptide--D-alanyl-D-alanine ligase, partial [Lachnospiraceae bacterium]|nr:UDP-N-acetylmuramoyl-tripeptide--D-alanyl-D-alanine ligase [Lachnospiraceae bacterium]
GIEKVGSLDGRFKVTETGKITVIDDCYNANPMSMKASCSILDTIDTGTVAILGDMGELGGEEEALHREVGTFVGGCRIDRFVTVGPLSENIDLGIRETRPDADVRHFDTVDALLPELSALVREGDAVLVKASHYMKFDRIVSELKEIF